MSTISQVSSPIAVATSPVVVEAVRDSVVPVSVESKKVEEVAISLMDKKTQEAFHAHRERVWTVLSGMITDAKKILEDLSLGWDLAAQAQRVGGLVVLGSTEAEQKVKIQTADTEEELLERLQHIQNKTLQGLTKLIPASHCFGPVVKFLKEKMTPAMEALLMECHDKAVE